MAIKTHLFSIYIIDLSKHCYRVEVLGKMLYYIIFCAVVWSTFKHEMRLTLRGYTWWFSKFIWKRPVTKNSAIEYGSGLPCFKLLMACQLWWWQSNILQGGLWQRRHQIWQVSQSCQISGELWRLKDLLRDISNVAFQHITWDAPFFWKNI